MPDEAKYLIIINMYAGNGYVETGQFIIGGDRSDAREVFDQLKGKPVATEKVLLRLDFVARNEQGPDTVLQMLGCTLCEMSENIKIIIRETFRIINLV